MPTVGIIPRIASEPAAELAREIVARLGRDVFVEEEAAIPGLPAMPGCDLATRAALLVVLGGDGTLIHAAGLCGANEVPILGVNMGTLGFLTEVPRERTFDLLDRALRGELQVSRRLMLRAEVRRHGETLLEGSVLNDAVVSKNALSRLARLEVSVDGHLASIYEADGLIVATPTGSTAYSLSAGGPIVHPWHDTILLTPICPHTLTQRPLVLPPTMPIRVRLVSPSDMYVTLDGSKGRPLELGDEMWVRAAPHRTLLLMNPDLDPFTVLRQKLRWGAR